jgi:hypothetical protein
VSAGIGEQSRSRYRLLLVALGIVWLILAAVLSLYWRQMGSQVEVTWETATEQGTAGFRLYRSEEKDGDYEAVEEDHFVESRGDAMIGAAYSYIDDQVESGKTYYYVLEEIEADGSRRRYEEDLLTYETGGAAWWRGVLIVFCCVMGAGMLFAGLKS